ncbi:MAG: NAD-binding protein [Candidatus Sericytochromatia bacterium]|nr:NAD-binding protein [Candidatus Sericytochromatia bacterium]
MKYIFVLHGLINGFLTQPKNRRNMVFLVRFFLIFVLLVALFSTGFHYFMALEGRSYSWVAAVYWTLVVMSTLGFGDITFTSDIGHLYSLVVLISGTVYMLMLLPFVLIQFVYLPWVEASSAARAPRELPPDTKDHVILTGLSPMEISLIRMLESAQMPYVLLVPQLEQALKLYDEGFRVMLGELDDPETYTRAQVQQAALVLASRSDPVNTNIVFTVREDVQQVNLVATASSPDSVDILELAGCSRVLQMGQILGQALARRVLGRDGKSHIIGEFGPLKVAEVAVGNTPLVGKTLKEVRLRDYANLNVVGVWDRGRFAFAGSDTLIQPSTVLILAGAEDQLRAYDQQFCAGQPSDAPVVIIGGGRVGRAAAETLQAQGLDYRIVEKLPERVKDPEKYVIGDAAALEVLHRAGIKDSSCVVVTTHDDDINIYLTIYCRRLRPDIQILGRANLERNVSTLHRAGADFVMSYATMGASMIFNMLKRANILTLTEGLDAFRLPVPPALVGRSLAEARIRELTGCNVMALIQGEQFEVNPDAYAPLPASADLIVIGDMTSEHRFLKQFHTD